MNLQWLPPISENLAPGLTKSFVRFDGGTYAMEKSELPWYSTRISLPNYPNSVQVDLANAQFAPLSPEEKAIAGNDNYKLSNTPPIEYRVELVKGQHYVYVNVLPFISQNGNTLKLVGFDLAVNYFGERKQKKSGARGFASNSVLASGDWYKIGIWQDGIYRLTYDYLKGLGWDLNTIQSDDIAIFGNGGGMLPQDNAEHRHDDLKENAIEIVDGGDGRINKGDYILFYGEGPHRWTYDGSFYTRRVNVYSDTTFYFLTYNSANSTAKRITSRSSGTISQQSTSSFDHYDIHEKEGENLISSGRMWVGHEFDIASKNTVEFEIPNVVTTEGARIKSGFVMRTIQGTSTMDVSVRQGPSEEVKDNGGVSGIYYANYGIYRTSDLTFSPQKDVVVDLEFTKGNSDATAWLDRVILNARRSLVMEGAHLQFRDGRLNTGEQTEYNLDNVTPAITIWDVTDPLEIRSQEFIYSNSSVRFITLQDTLKEFIAFYQGGHPEPAYYGKVENQDLHARVSEFPDLIIVTHPKFLSAANDLAEFRRTNDELDVLVAETDDIFNEFSGGAQDITAVKDFVRMFWEGAGGDPNLEPRFLLLMGDASYDYKHRTSGNTNYIPTFQAVESLLPTASYASDDYFALVGPTDSDKPTDIVKLGVGRFPIKSLSEANSMVQKLKRYESQEAQGAWRNRITFVGDDEDGQLHMSQADQLSDILDTLYKDYNIERIYFDAFKQESTPGGDRYPEVNERLNQAVQNGALVMTYVGHGGELGWAHERVLEVADINKWSNAYQMPLMVTATCEFSRFDDPKRTSAGEFVFLNPDGGGIGLLTTTRVVYSQPNFELGKAFNEVAYLPMGNGEMPRLGDLSQLTKAAPGNDKINSRAFAILGDPSMRLAYPEHNVVTTQGPDSVKALEKVTFKGYVADENGSKLTDFNGIIYPLVYDKKKQVNTLDNDGFGVFTYQDRFNVIFRGKASVVNGEWEFSFVVPRDISSLHGKGKVSYYATDGLEDANGYYEEFVIGGMSDNAAADNQGPDIDLYLNDEQFVQGGLTDVSPDLLANLFDENGINTSGNGVGHDIVAVLDANTANAIVLNDHYESETDSYQKGSIRYPLSDLEPGEHTLSLKAWDVYNNSGTAETSFLVTNDQNLVIAHLLNYPNPFTTNTSFYFEHNYPNQELQVRLQVFSLSGTVVKTMDGFFTSDGYRIGPIVWNGRDEYGDPIGRGAYVYKLKVTAPSGEIAEKFEKLVILN